MKMRCYKLLYILLLTKLVTGAGGQNATPVESQFRILAPQFICPKDENAIVDKPDTTIITIQPTGNTDLRIEWRVRWNTMSPAPAQRTTLMLWRTVRALERQLNKPPPEPYVYVIENSELLPGVEYTFFVSSVDSNGELSESKSFNIDNTQGEKKLMIEGRNDLLSVQLVGAQVAFADAAFVVEAEVTTCKPDQDYYFSWTVQSLGSNDSVDVSQVRGTRLEVPRCTLKVGFTYNVICQVMRYNTGDLITQTSLPFLVKYRGLESYLNVDQLLITKDTPFTLNPLIISHDYCTTTPVNIEYECSHSEKSCNSTITVQNETISFLSGLPELGEYFINITTTLSNETSTANATLVVVDPILPVLQIDPISRAINEGSVVNVVANASNLAPSCTLSWYFASSEYLASLNLVASNDTCDDCEHGEALSETVTIHSLEEQFLDELSDFSNDTEWRQVSASFPASAGRARVVAKCGCSLAFNCQTMGSVHADLWFKLNEKPVAKDTLVSPESGTALETVYRVSTLAAVEQDTPLEYSFYCTAGDDTILLGSYLEHRDVETVLPYAEGGISVWVKVCDALGACSKSASKDVTLAPGESRTVEALITDAGAHARRCELTLLARVVKSVVITYTNTHQYESLTKFYESLHKSLSRIDKENCVGRYYDQYSALLLWLADHGVEINHLTPRN